MMVVRRLPSRFFPLLFFILLPCTHKTLHVDALVSFRTPARLLASPQDLSSPLYGNSFRPDFEPGGLALLPCPSTTKQTRASLAALAFNSTWKPGVILRVARYCGSTDCKVVERFAPAGSTPVVPPGTAIATIYGANPSGAIPVAGGQVVDGVQRAMALGDMAGDDGIVDLVNLNANRDKGPVLSQLGSNCSSNTPFQTSRVTSQPAGAFNTQTVHLWDVDYDGDLDIVMPSGNSVSSFVRAMWIENLGSSFALEQAMFPGQTETYPSPRLYNSEASFFVDIDRVCLLLVVVFCVLLTPAPKPASWLGRLLGLPLPLC
jgi:hypothetical protein